jgi:ABC-type glutathione transport system ATPase component
MTDSAVTPRGDLRIEGLSVVIPKPSGDIPVLSDVWLQVPAGRAVALVGASGAGKSMTASAILKLFPVPSRITEGKILLNGTDLVPLSEREMQAYRGRRIAVIFQEPTSALDPVMSVGDQVKEGRARTGGGCPTPRRARPDVDAALPA